MIFFDIEGVYFGEFGIKVIGKLKFKLVWFYVV